MLRLFDGPDGLQSDSEGDMAAEASDVAIAGVLEAAAGAAHCATSTPTTAESMAASEPGIVAASKMASAAGSHPTESASAAPYASETQAVLSGAVSAGSQPWIALLVLQAGRAFQCCGCEHTIPCIANVADHSAVHCFAQHFPCAALDRSSVHCCG